MIIDWASKPTEELKETLASYYVALDGLVDNKDPRRRTVTKLMLCSAISAIEAILHSRGEQ